MSPRKRAGLHRPSPRLGLWLALLALTPAEAIPARAQQPDPARAIRSPSGAHLVITVQDENRVAVPSVRVTLQPVKAAGARRYAPLFSCETDFAGRCELANALPGVYELRVEKEGFFALVEKNVEVGKAANVEVTLSHQRESVTHVNVIYSPPAIDRAQTTSRSTLTAQQIVDLPYPVTRDIRYALPLLPGVLQDSTGQVHVSGAESRQTFDQLDGFNINAPASGLLTLRVNVDAIRSVELQNSRYPAEYGKGSGGILSFATGMGDDHFRFSGTDFLPSLQDRKGLHVDSWTPRGVLSGPLRKGKAWFLLAPEGEYDLNIVRELPPGADQTSAWRFGNLAKAQVNLTAANILTGSFLVNHFRSYHTGLSQFNPLSTTVNLDQSAHLWDVKDQAFFSNGALLELGLAQSGFGSGLQPMGTETYVITPDGTQGNFYAVAHGYSSRLEGIGNLYLPPLDWHGRHELKLGVDLDRLTFHQTTERNPYLILREDGSLSRGVAFSPIAAYGRDNFEASGYFQDHWTLSDRWTVDPGVRMDWDEIVRDVWVSPRLAMSFVPTRRADTKVVAGIGMAYDSTDLTLLTEPEAGRRTDSFYDSTGQTLVAPPVETSFQVAQARLREPRFLNWSVGVEHRLPAGVYLNLQFLEKRGRHGWTYFNQSPVSTGALGGTFVFRDARRDRYDSFQASARKSFASGHFVFASYTYSRARSNAVFDFSVDNPVFSQQAAGPLAWDSPHRFLSWGYLPLRKRFNLAYVLNWRDGFPFTLVNQDQQLVAPPGARRFPTYFSLNVALERRFQIFHLEWAVRAGFDNITNRHNPTVVDNNVDSPRFLTFGGLEGRALTGRIRLLGRK